EEKMMELTGGSWIKQRMAFEALDRKGFDYCGNTVVVEENYKDLPKIAAEVIQHRIYLHNFILHNAYYAWSDGRARGTQARYIDVYPYLREAVEILDAAGVGVNIRYAPLCSMAGLEKHVVGIVGVRFDPYEWGNAIEHMPGIDGGYGDPVMQGKRLPSIGGQPSPGAELLPARGKIGDMDIFNVRGIGAAKVFPRDPCGACKSITVCDGVDGNYLNRNGSKEFVPYAIERGENLDTARINYLAPFFVKLKPDASMKDVVKASILPEKVKAQPSVAIIIPSYNQEMFIMRAIDSALAQTYKNVQVIVCDDASTDRSRSIIESYKTGIGAIYNDTNSGQPAYMRNAGIFSAGLSMADLILCLDADDWIEPTMVEECVKAFEENPDAGIVYTGTQCFGLDEVYWPAGKFEYGMLIHGNQFSYCSMFKREIWEKVNGFKTNVRGAEDWSFWIEAAGLGYKAVGIDKPLFHYRRNKEGLFETDVVPHFDDKFRQIILNNPELYPAAMSEDARAGVAIRRQVS
ncbi:MAG: glycosyltransferase family 2 protein, partial [Patescibacteria group bacterium]|nr:glycosyltransferase family 2 protein [Patescibacteria group bacterium]